MVRMLIVGYCYGLRLERRLTQEVELHLGYRWFCGLGLEEKVPPHSTFSENRLHRFRQSDVFRRIFERVVAACMTAGLVKGEVFYGNIGSEDRLDFTVVGPAVNEVSRIASMCNSIDREFLASSEFCKGLDATGRGYLV